MVGRRSSQPGSPATFPSLSNRIRSPDIPDGQALADIVGSGSRVEAVGEQKAILTLVNKLVNKLPCNSGLRLGVMEADAGVQATVEALVQMAKIRSPGVVHALTSQLELLAKDAPIDTVHSQIYVLHVLHLCLSASWRHHSAASSSRAPKSDPPPLDDNLARYLLMTTLTYTHLVGPVSTGTDRTGSPGPGKDSRTRELSTSSSIARIASSMSSNNLSKSAIKHDVSDSPRGRAVIKPGPISSSCSTAATSADQLILYLQHIVAYLTASNWPLVYGRIRSRLSHLCTTIEEAPDLTDLRLIEWVYADRSRLAQLLQELNSSYAHIKRHAQIAVAAAMHRAIWNWIEHHPEQFEAMTDSGKKLEGGPDTLFDILYSAADISSSSSARRTKASYPLMAMLLVLCPDTMKRVALGDLGKTSSSLAKKLSFVETLRKGLTANKGFEACASCYVDFVGVASRLGTRYESAGVRSLVADIQNDLKNALFQSSTSSDQSDPEVLINGLVNLYRVNGGGGFSSTFLKLLTDGSDARRLLAIRAATVIAEEGNEVQAFPPREALRRDLAGTVRNMIKLSARQLLGDRSTPQRPRTPAELPSPSHAVLSEMLELIIADPGYGYHVTGQESPTDGLPSFLTTLGSLMVGPTPPAIRSLASKAAVEILEDLVQRIKVDAGLVPVCRGLGPAVSAILVDSGRQELFNLFNIDFDQIAESTALLRATCRAVLHFAQACPEALLSCPQALPAIALASQTISTSLLSMDSKSASMCQPTLVDIQQLLILLLEPAIMKLEREAPGSQKLAEMKSRLRTYDMLVSMPPAIGRQHYQRVLKGVCKKLTVPTAVTTGIWFGLEHTWKQLNARIIAAEADHSYNGHSDSRRRDLASTSDIDGLSTEESRCWQDCTAVLCSMGAIMISPLDTGPSVAQMVGPNIMPQIYEELPAPKTELESFVQDSIGLLAAGNALVRECVKDALGTDLPTACSRILFSQLLRSMSIMLGTNSSITEYATNFADHAIAIIKLNLDRMPTSAEAENTPIDLGEIFLGIARHLHLLGRGDLAVRLKARLCAAIEAALGVSMVSLGSRAKVGNSLFDWILEWMADAGKEADGNNRDLEIAALRCLAPLSEGLTFQAPGYDGSEVQAPVQSRLFLRAFQLLIRIIEQPGVGREDVSVRRALSIHSHRGEKPASASPIVDSSSLAVSILSNIVCANIDIGLKHCLSLGYHRDHILRIAFMQIISHSLRHGAKLGSVNPKRQSTKSRPFLDALTSGNMALAVAIIECCGAGETDEISAVLFQAFEAKGTLISFLRVLIEREVAQTNHESELFRANSITTRLLTYFAKTYGYNYLRVTLQPLIFSLIDKPAETSFELDPAKAGLGAEDIKRNADHLQLMCQALLDLICLSVPRVPVMLRVICHYIWEAVEDRYPESRHSAVGSFIFLRFFCPSIVAPENIELEMPPDSRDLRRGLLLITKVIQNLANNVTFGNKEPHMKVLNAFLRQNITQVTKFLSDVAIRPRSHEVATILREAKDEAERTQDVDENEQILHRFAYKHYERLTACLNQLPATYRAASSMRPERTPMDGRASARKLQELSERVGAPVEFSKLDGYTRARMFEDFMKQHQGRNTEAVENVFYEGPAGQSGRRIFYLVVSEIGLTDHETLGHHIFSHIADATESFDIIIDMTGFMVSSDLPLVWMKRMLQICPPSVLSLVNVIALYNPNTNTRRKLKRIISELTPITGPVGKQIIAASHPRELQDCIPFITLALPEQTLELAYSVPKVYKPILKIGDHDMQMQVGVKVGDDCIQLGSWRQLDLTPNLKSYIVDVIPFKDIDDIISTSGADADRLTIKFGQNESISLAARFDAQTSAESTRSTLRELEADIRSARSRLRDTPSSQRALRPNDVPGTLLNVALLNMHVRDDALRAASYGLLSELAIFFRFDYATRVPRIAAGIMPPRNSAAFTTAIAQQMATTSPQLTLEFLREWAVAFSRMDVPLRTACLQYIGYWIPNLETIAQPSREDSAETLKNVAEVIRNLISLTHAEVSGLHLLLHERIWRPLGKIRGAFAEILLFELLQTAVDSGLGSARSESIADILVSIASTSVRGKVFTRLRKAIARTYINSTSSIEEHSTWSEICVLARMAAVLAYQPSTGLDAQLYLPEILHSLTLLAGSGPLTMRQTVYGLFINVLQSLASSALTGEMDGTILNDLLVRAQEPEIMACFRLIRIGGAYEIAGTVKDDADLAALDSVERLAKFLDEVLAAAAVSTDCANSWRVRWMGFVASTCFQHNPATQPQAFTVLGCLATEEVDDDLVYQILVAMCSVLNQYSDHHTTLLSSMIRCMSRIIPGLLPDSRYSVCVFWLAIGILQLGHLSLFSPALELASASLKGMSNMGTLTGGLDSALLDGRLGAGEAGTRMDQLTGINFESELHFSLVAVIWKGMRHSSTRQASLETLILLVRLAGKTSPQSSNGINGSGSEKISRARLPYFVALLPVLAGSQEELRDLFAAADLPFADDGSAKPCEHDLFKLLPSMDDTTSLLVIILAAAILQSSSSDTERMILYRFLADASAAMPNVFSVVYDFLIPRMNSVLASTANPSILTWITEIMERAMLDPTYTFQSATTVIGMGTSESVTSLNHTSTLSQPHFQHLHHQKSYSASISSIPSTGLAGAAHGSSSGVVSQGVLTGKTELVLEELNMKGLVDLTFSVGTGDKVAQLARLVAAIIISFTS